MNDLLQKESVTLQSTATPEKIKNNEPWYKNKLKLGIVITGVILVIAIAVVIGVVASKKKCKSCDCDQKYCENIIDGDDNNQNNNNNNPPNDDINPTNEEENTQVVNVNYKKNEVNIYNDVTSKTSTVVIEKEGTGRRLEEEKKETITTYNGKYLLNVYNIDNTIEPNVYYAYAVLLNLEKNINGKSNNLGGSDITTNNNDFPFIKFSFDSNGKLGKLYTNKDYDKILTGYIYEFIEKVVPLLDKKSYGRRLNGEPELSFNKKDNKTYLNKGEKKEFEGFEGSKNDRNIETVVEGNKIKEVNTNSKTSFEPKNNFNVDKSSTFSVENEDNNFAKRKSPIKGFYETSDSNLKLESSEENEELSNKINNNINPNTLIEYTNEDNSNSSTENRVLNSRLLSKNQLRNLDDIYLDPWGQPINFFYPLFNVDFLGAKIGLYSNISFTPANGKLEVNVMYLKNNEFITIGTRTVRTNFDEIYF